MRFSGRVLSTLGVESDQVGQCVTMRFIKQVALSMMCVVSVVSRVDAQRFEGVITMKITAPRVAGRGQGARGDAGRGDGGRADMSGRARGGEVGRGRGRGADSAGRGDVAGRGDAAGRGAGRANGEPMNGMQFTMPSEIEYMTRRGKLRISLGGVGTGSVGAMIYLPDEGLMYTLIPSASMYMQTSIAEMTARTQAAAGVMDSARLSRRQMIASQTIVTHTKKFELIAGHRCEHIAVVAGKEKTDICMAKGRGTFIMPAVLGQNQAWQTATDAANGFPLKVIQTDGTVAMEVTKVERKALSESLFSVPESYSKMPDMMTRRPPAPPPPG